jgi:two-component system, sensor histidine kinase and response regulator
MGLWLSLGQLGILLGLGLLIHQNHSGSSLGTNANALDIQAVQPGPSIDRSVEAPKPSLSHSAVRVRSLSGGSISRDRSAQASNSLVIAEADSPGLNANACLIDVLLLGLGGISLAGSAVFERLRRELLILGQAQPTTQTRSSIRELRLVQERLQRQTEELSQAIAAHNEQVDSLETIAEAQRRAEQAKQQAEQAQQQAECAKQEALLAEQKADASNRAKSDFLAQMSHELRTPLNAVLGFSQLMRHDPTLSAKNREHLDIVSRSGHHLLNLINDVLELSKIESGRQEIELSQVNLGSFSDSIIALFRLRAESKGLILRFDRSPDLPRQVILDEQKVRQILINLLENAIKFTCHGHVMLRMSIEPIAGEQQQASPAPESDNPDSAKANPAPSHRLCFDVEDSGPGLTAEEISRLFQPFSQTELGRQSQQGSGLGLCISRGFAELMGGTIKLYPARPHGSIFRLTLPTIVSPDAPVRPSQIHAIPREIAPGQTIPRILIVDDRRLNRSLINQFLTSVGFITREASNGQEAIEQWSRWRPDLILMDLEMPILDGKSAAEAILHQTPIGTIPPVIIAVTAMTFDSSPLPQDKHLFDGLLHKPIEAPVLFHLLGQHLRIQYHYDDFAIATGHDEDRQEPLDTTYSRIYKSPDWPFPPDWLDHLEQAAIELDIPRLETLIAEIAPRNGELAKTLTEQIANFDFDQILHCVSLAKRSG